MCDQDDNPRADLKDRIGVLLQVAAYHEVAHGLVAYQHGRQVCSVRLYTARVGYVGWMCQTGSLSITATVDIALAGVVGQWLHQRDDQIDTIFATFAAEQFDSNASDDYACALAGLHSREAVIQRAQLVHDALLEDPATCTYLHKLAEMIMSRPNYTLRHDDFVGVLEAASPDESIGRNDQANTQPTGESGDRPDTCDGATQVNSE